MCLLWFRRAGERKGSIGRLKKCCAGGQGLRVSRGLFWPCLLRAGKDTGNQSKHGKCKIVNPQNHFLCLTRFNRLSGWSRGRWKRFNEPGSPGVFLQEGADDHVEPGGEQRPEEIFPEHLFRKLVAIALADVQ